MEHANKMINELQTTAEAVERGRYSLGTWTILSALYTEYLLNELLEREIFKFDEFNANDTTPNQKIEFDRAVADFLKHFCCVEEAVIRKIKVGMELNEYPATIAPDSGSCCSR